MTCKSLVQKNLKLEPHSITCGVNKIKGNENKGHETHFKLLD